MDWGHACGEGIKCTLHNLHCAYPNCYKGKNEKRSTEMTTRVLMINFGPSPIHIGTKNPTTGVETYTDQYPVYPGHTKDQYVHDGQEIVIKEDVIHTS